MEQVPGQLELHRKTLSWKTVEKKKKEEKKKHSLWEMYPSWEYILSF